MLSSSAHTGLGMSSSLSTCSWREEGTAQGGSGESEPGEGVLPWLSGRGTRDPGSSLAAAPKTTPLRGPGGAAGEAAAASPLGARCRTRRPACPWPARALAAPGKRRGRPTAPSCSCPGTCAHPPTTHNTHAHTMLCTRWTSQTPAPRRLHRHHGALPSPPLLRRSPRRAQRLPPPLLKAPQARTSLLPPCRRRPPTARPAPPSPG